MSVVLVFFPLSFIANGPVLKVGGSFPVFFVVLPLSFVDLHILPDKVAALAASSAVLELSYVFVLVRVAHDSSAMGFVV